MADFTIKQGDTVPAMIGHLFDANGPVDLSSAQSVFLHVAHVSTGRVLINAACSVLDAVAGEISYAWQPADTLTPGDYEFEFLVVWNNSAPEHFPNTTVNLRLHIGATLA